MLYNVSRFSKALLISMHVISMSWWHCVKDRHLMHRCVQTIKKNSVVKTHSLIVVFVVVVDSMQLSVHIY